MFLIYSPNNKAYKVFNKSSKTVMESPNVVVDDQGTIPTGPRLDESETEGPLHASGDDASTNDATPRNRSSPDTEDASRFAKSSSQLKDPTTSSKGSNQEASRQVKKDRSITCIIGDLDVEVRTRGKPKVN